MGTTTHEKSFAFFCQYLEEDVNTPLCKELQQHLEECPECRHNLITIQKTIALYKQAQPQGRLSQEAKRKFLEKIIGKTRS